MKFVSQMACVDFAPGDALGHKSPTHVRIKLIFPTNYHLRCRNSAHIRGRVKLGDFRRHSTMMFKMHSQVCWLCLHFLRTFDSALQHWLPSKIKNQLSQNFWMAHVFDIRHINFDKLWTLSFAFEIVNTSIFFGLLSASHLKAATFLIFDT